MTFGHTPQTDARIRQAYANGERISDVAAELGCTRNVIIGRAYRIGVCEAGNQYRYHSTEARSRFNSEAAKRGWESEERRKLLSERMRLYWAKRRFQAALEAAE